MCPHTQYYQPELFGYIATLSHAKWLQLWIAKIHATHLGSHTIAAVTNLLKLLKLSDISEVINVQYVAGVREHTTISVDIGVIVLE